MNLELHLDYVHVYNNHGMVACEVTVWEVYLIHFLQLMVDNVC